MSLVVAKNLWKSYDTARYVLREVSVTISPGQRVALVGPNGEGKSTLLKLITAQEPPTDGRVHTQRGLRMGYLPQEPLETTVGTLWESALSAFEHLQRLEEQVAQARQAVSEAPQDAQRLRRLGDLEHRFDAGGGYRFRQQAREVLAGLGFEPAEHDRPLSQLSGGQRTRVLLAKLILSQVDLLLLDEPTNHLDLGSVEWLERWLAAQTAAAVVVSHDRRFLDGVAQHVWELSAGRLEEYPGNYSQYLQQRAIRYKQRLRQWQAQQEHIAATEQFIARHHAGQRSKEARGRRTRLERFLKDEAIDRPVEVRHIRVRLGSGDRGGDMVLRCRDLAAGYDPTRPLVEAGDLDVTRGRRVAVIGPNGSGKTTLVRTLLGRLRPLSGQVQMGDGIRVGYLSQTYEDLDGGATALANLLAVHPEMKPQQGRSLLGQFLFDLEHADRPAGQLSGGQCSRLMLARLAVQQPNLLVLDEPTNHLDIPSQEILQEVLSGYDGTMLLVSHDRYLVSAVADEIWNLQEGRLQRFPGGYEAFCQWRARQESPAQAGQAEAARPGKEYQKARRAQRLQERRRRELSDLEQQITQLEARLGELNQQISTAGQAGDVSRVRELGQDYQTHDRRLRQLLEQWEQLARELES
jgi:ATP-binding cassette subfamily F protein 3